MRPPARPARAASLVAIVGGSASIGLAACLLPSYTLETTSGTGGAGTSTGGTGGTAGTSTSTDTTGGGGSGGTTSSMSTDTTGGGGAGGATTSTTSTEPCTDCPDWAVSFGSQAEDTPVAIAASASNDIAVGGEHLGAFTVPPDKLVPFVGGSDGWLARLSPQGAGLSGLGLSGDSPAPDNQLVTDVAFAGEAVIVAGQFTGTLKLSPAVTLGAAGLGAQGFVARYSSGGALEWSQTFGDTGNDGVSAVAVDAAGNVVVAGTYTGAANFFGKVLDQFGGGANCFVLKLDAAGQVLPDASFTLRSWGSPDNDVITDLAVGADGGVFVLGNHTKALAFDEGSVPGVQNNSAAVDAYLVRLDPAGSYLIAKGFGGAGSQRAFGIAVDAGGAAYVAGIFDGTLSFGNTSLMDTIGGPDVFIARLDASANATWAKQILNAGALEPVALALAPDGGPILAGGFLGTTDFLSGTMVTAADLDPFVLRLDPGGNYVKHRVWSAPGSQRANAIAVDGTGALLMAGELAGPIDFGTGTLPVVGASDVFLLRHLLSAL